MNNPKSIIRQQQAYELWFGISLLIPFYFGLISLYFAFHHNYVVQDDARQHVVWLQRYVDSNLFPNDAIADYFTSVAPLGYKSFYWGFAKLGIEPIILAKILPLFLAIIATYYLFLFSYSVLPLPVASFWCCLFFNQLIWLNDDLVSATPRAFIYPLFAAFLYYFSKRSVLLCLTVMAIQGLFYPQVLLVQLATVFVSIITFMNHKPMIKITKNKSLFIISSLIVSCLVLLPYILIESPFTPVVTSQQMHQMPEFNLGGRSPYFSKSAWLFWFMGSSGLNLPKFPTIVWLGFTLPWLVKCKTTITKLISHKISAIYQVFIASIFMFFIAHILLPKLHLPSRYTYHSLRFLIAIATGIIITIIVNKIFTNKERNSAKIVHYKLVKISTVTLLLIITIFPAFPMVFINWFQNWQIGTQTELYQYLSNQPKDIVIASLSSEADIIPAFTHRSVLVAREFAIAYHTKYYQQFQQKTIALIKAQYSSNLKDIKKLISTYKISYFLLDYDAFTPEYLLEKDWLIRSSFTEITEDAIAKMEKSEDFAIKKLINQGKCVVLNNSNLYLLKADCIQNQDVI